VRKFIVIVPVCLYLFVIGGSITAQPQAATYENSFILAPLYVEYQHVSDQEFANQVQQLRSQIPAAPYVKIGFATFLSLEFPDLPLDQPFDPSGFQDQLANLDTIVDRARANGTIVHLALVSNLFHGHTPLRVAAIRQDVRNAQWFSDGWIADPADVKNPVDVPVTAWVTPSRYAEPLHDRIEEEVRAFGTRLAQKMQQYPDTLLTLSGDGEVEFSLERNYTSDGTKLINPKNIIYTDYSPFVIAEFRDWIRNSRYAGDSSPNTDDDGDGHTFNGDFGQNFTSWNLQYFDNSGPISFAEYFSLPDKLPKSGKYFIAGGFDAPRQEKPGDPFWSAWIDFRKMVIRNWVKSFATWITTSPDPDTGFTVPASHFYTHQIPADFIFGHSDDPRLKTSASYVETAVIDPIGSTGVTAFNGWDGRRAFKTATPMLFSALFMTSDNWGILEYNPSLPYANNIAPSSDPQYYASELRNLWNFRPHLLVPFAWSDDPVHKAANIKNSQFGKALRDFVNDVGKKPWFSWRAILR